MNVLHPPLAVVERDDGEFAFFRSVDDMLNDRYDILWGEAYDGWDTAGQYFSLVRREAPHRWWHSQISSDRTFLVVDSVRPGFRMVEAEERIRRALKSTASDFSGLLLEGVTHPLFGTEKR